MSTDTIRRSDLTNAVLAELGVSRHEAAELVESVLSTISDALCAGEDVKLSGFGSFELREKSARTGRNPKTGQEVPITPRRVLVFKASPVLKERVAAGPRITAEAAQ